MKRAQICFVVWFQNFIPFLHLVAREETNLPVSLRSLFQGNFITFLERTELFKKLFKKSPGTPPYDHTLGNRFLTK